MTVVVTLALGIAANTLIYSILYGVLLRTLPYKEPQQLYALFRLSDESGQKEKVPYWSFPKYLVMKEQSRAFDTAAFFQQPLPLTGTDNTERLEVEFVTPNYFHLLGIDVTLGRTFTESDKVSPVALIGHDLWARRFNGQTDLSNKTLQLDRKQLSIIGVLPKHFRGQSGTAHVWVPIEMLPSFTFPRRLQTAYAYWHEVIARVRPHIPLNMVESDLKRVADRIEAAFPHYPGTTPEQLLALRLQHANLDPRLKHSLLLLTSAVTLVLLISCVNVANMNLVRSVSRRKEIGIRTALGANRARIIQLILSESGMLAFFGAVLAVVFAVWGADILRVWLPESQSSSGWHPFRIFSAVNPLQQPVLAFTFLMSCAAAVLVGLPVAFQSSNYSPSEVLKNGMGTSLPAQKLAKFLISAEVALSLVLLTCAGLMFHSFWNLQSTNLGIKTDNVLTLKIDYPRDYDSAGFQEMLLQRISAIPGILSASVASTTPLSSAYGSTKVTIAGRPRIDPESRPSIGFHIVSEKYFQTLGIPLLRGRNFSSHDRDRSQRVAIVNQTAAQRFWPNQDPIGQRIQLGLGWEPPNDFARIIAIAGDVKYGKAEEPPQPDAYLFYLQPTGELSPFLLLCSKLETGHLARDVRTLIQKMDSNLPVYDVKTMKERIGDANSAIRFIALVLGIFAALALCLSGIGIFAVTSYTVSRRKKEIAIRMALGAHQWDALKQTMLEIGKYITVGASCGLAFAMLTARLFRAVLFHVLPEDPLTICLSAAIMIAVALVATYLPARQATRVDPMNVLKSQ